MTIIVRDIINRIDYHDYVKERLTQLVPFSHEQNMKIIPLDGREIRVENKESYPNIIINATPPAIGKIIEIDQTVPIMEYIGITKYRDGNHPSYPVMRDENGFPLLYMDTRYKDYYIPFDVFELGKEVGTEMLAKIITIGFPYFQDFKERQYVWSDETKDTLLATLKEQIDEISGQELSNARYQLENARSNEEKYRKRLRDAIMEIQTQMQRIRELEANESNLSTKLVSEFDLIMKNPDVQDIRIKDKKIIVKTNKLVCRADTGSLYDVGTFRIEYNLTSTGIRYFGDTPRKSYWTDNDPHPHVDGRTGNPCLGNISEAVAQLSSMNEYAALVSVAIEFLKSANTSDPAGRNVVRWDEIDEHGNVIREGADAEQDLDTWTCDHCEESFGEDADSYTVYGSADAEDYWDEGCVCEECRDHYYAYSEHHDEVIHEDCPREAFEGPEEEVEDEEETEEVF